MNISVLLCACVIMWKWKAAASKKKLNSCAYCVCVFVCEFLTACILLYVCVWYANYHTTTLAGLKTRERENHHMWVNIRWMFLSSHTHTHLIQRYTKFTISRAVTQKRTQSSEEDKQASARQEPRSTTQSTQTTDVSFVPVVVCRVSYRRCRRPFANTSQSRTHHGQSARSLIPSVLRNTLRRVALFTVTHCARQQAFGRVVVSYFALLGTARVRLRCCCNPHTHTSRGLSGIIIKRASVCVCARGVNGQSSSTEISARRQFFALLVWHGNAPPSCIRRRRCVHQSSSRSVVRISQSFVGARTWCGRYFFVGKNHFSPPRCSGIVVVVVNRVDIAQPHTPTQHSQWPCVYVNRVFSLLSLSPSVVAMNAMFCCVHANANAKWWMNNTHTHKLTESAHK